jgi:flagellar hook-length control protein FliK
MLTRLVETMRWQTREGGGHAEIRLRPEGLGVITVSVVVRDGVVSATVSAATPAAMDVLRGEAGGLQDALKEHGLTLDELVVLDEPEAGERDNDAEERRRQSEEADHRATARRGKGDRRHDVFDVLV